VRFKLHIMNLLIIAAYMVCAILFIFCLINLSRPDTAKRGNYYGIIAMTLAVIVTLFVAEFHYNVAMFLPPLVVGGLFGLVLACRVEISKMPQLVAILHCFVGVAGLLVCYARFLLQSHTNVLEVIEISLGVFIGAFTISGSIVAWGKLQEVIRRSPVLFLGWGRHVINMICLMVCFILAVLFGRYPHEGVFYLLGMTLVALFLGWHIVMGVEGTDIPVVVSMLNSYSGMVTVVTGFCLDNHLLIITGTTVAASGAILSYIMCRAMNRSFLHVILGGGKETTSASTPTTGKIKEISVNDLTNDLLSARTIVIVPGYGMAASKSHKEVGVLANILIRRGASVRFCVHPVAGRLPGHMNVLLAEANVSYDIVEEMSMVNDDFSKTDLVLVVGANDIVNPDALENPASPIAGMPVCEVWKAKRVVVFKRGKGTGYASVKNPLFYKEGTWMFYGSADKSLKVILNRITDVMVDMPVLTPETHRREEDIPEAEIPSPVMSLGVPREITKGEARVAVPPSLVKKFRKLGFKVLVEHSAGRPADYFDQAYTDKGAHIVDAVQVWQCDLVLKVRVPQGDELSKLGSVKCLVSYFSPSDNAQLLEELAQRYPRLSVVAMDCVPRITRAQKLDSLSSMANIAGYRAVVEAFNVYRRSPRAQVTAAGKLPPANVFVIGAGVAGLAAIGYCKSLGCIVRAFDVRPAAKEQAESVGAEFIEVKVKEDGSGRGGYAKEMSAEFLEAQKQMTRAICKISDIVITTALIPGRPAPKLLEQDAVRAMKPGSVVVDMAAERGGNCTLTVPDRAVMDEPSGVWVIGYTDLVSRMAPQSSELYGNNMCHLLQEMGGAEQFNLDLTNEVIREMTVLHNGKVTWLPFDQRPPPTPLPKLEAAIGSEEGPWDRFCDTSVWIGRIFVLGGLFIVVALFTSAEFISLLFSLTLAMFIGYMTIWNVPASLYTPLMSVTNAICGIIIIGAMLVLTPNDAPIDGGSALGVLGVFFASINIVGGFIVTHRMLRMFRQAR
jgi:NAD(P) transhydrogenase